MKQDFFPYKWNSNMAHQLRRYHVPTSGSLNSANVQQDVSGILATLELSFGAAFVNLLKPITVREFGPSSLLKCLSQFWTHQIPMNSCFSLMLIIMTYQSHDEILRLRLQKYFL